MPWSSLIPHPDRPFLRDIAFVSTYLRALTFPP
jgi:hypothetical protein